jgi:hypothetical protein
MGSAPESLSAQLASVQAGSLRLQLLFNSIRVCYGLLFLQVDLWTACQTLVFSSAGQVGRLSS